MDSTTIIMHMPHSVYTHTTTHIFQMYPPFITYTLLQIHTTYSTQTTRLPHTQIQIHHTKTIHILYKNQDCHKTQSPPHTPQAHHIYSTHIYTPHKHHKHKLHIYNTLIDDTFTKHHLATLFIHNPCITHMHSTNTLKTITMHTPYISHTA